MGPYLNYPNGNTGVYGAYFKAVADPNNANDYVDSTKPYPSGNYNWVDNLIGTGLTSYPYSTVLWGAAGAAVSLLLNYLQVTPGVSTHRGTGSAKLGDILAGSAS